MPAELSIRIRVGAVFLKELRHSRESEAYVPRSQASGNIASTHKKKHLIQVLFYIGQMCESVEHVAEPELNFVVEIGAFGISWQQTVGIQTTDAAEVILE